MAGQELVGGGGVLLQHELDPAKDAADSARQLKLIFLTRQLLRHSTGDAVFLSLSAAASEAGVDMDQATEMLRGAITNTGRAYPHGFM